MFHLSTVERNTLQTLEEIFVLPEIGQHFALAGDKTNCRGGNTKI
jgi:hypothetical protein